MLWSVLHTGAILNQAHLSFDFVPLNILEELGGTGQWGLEFLLYVRVVFYQESISRQEAIIPINKLHSPQTKVN